MAMLKTERMFPVGTEKIKPKDEEKMRAARNYPGSKINETTPKGPVYLTPRPDTMDEDLKRQNIVDFEQAQTNKRYLDNEK